MNIHQAGSRGSLSSSKTTTEDHADNNDYDTGSSRSSRPLRKSNENSYTEEDINILRPASSTINDMDTTDKLLSKKSDKRSLRENSDSFRPTREEYDSNEKYEYYDNRRDENYLNDKRGNGRYQYDQYDEGRRRHQYNSHYDERSYDESYYYHEDNADRNIGYKSEQYQYNRDNYYRDEDLGRTRKKHYGDDNYDYRTQKIEDSSGFSDEYNAGYSTEYYERDNRNNTYDSYNYDDERYHEDSNVYRSNGSKNRYNSGYHKKNRLSELDELREQYDLLLNDYKYSQENEEIAKNSLEKIQLSNKSQLALIKSNYKKKIDFSNVLMKKMLDQLQIYEGTLDKNSINFEKCFHLFMGEFCELSKKEEESQSHSNIDEHIVLAEDLSTLRQKVDKLSFENMTLKSALETAEEKLLHQQKNNSFSNESTGTPDNSVNVAENTSVQEKNMKKRIQILEHEKAKLIQLLKDAQKKLIERKELNAMTEINQNKTNGLDEVHVRPIDFDRLKEKYEIVLAKLEKAERIIRKDGDNLKRQDLQNTTVPSVDKLGDGVTAEVKSQIIANELSAEEYNQKLQKFKETSNNEILKIKEHAKKAILELRKQLDNTKKSNNPNLLALNKVKKSREDVSKVKNDLKTIRHAIVTQNQQFPKLSKSIIDKISAKLVKQNDAYKEIVENYRKEVKERKKLFNIVQELKGNIRVLCRFRPISKNELTNGSKDVCNFINTQEVSLTNEKGKTKSWEFDKVFSPQSTQEQFFDEVKSLVTSVMDGYNVCIFAYGQTGSGKTFTMTGTNDNAGVNIRSLVELFNKKDDRKNEYKDEISVSVLEIYNEDIHDLLSDKNKESLAVRQGPNGNYVQDLIIKKVGSLEEVNELVTVSNKNRSTHATDMNDYSSRSHSILSIYLKSTSIITSNVSYGKLHLVDLAGSERLSKTGATGQRLKEAQNINKSLSALGDVISARASKSKHVPYRNSTLTFLLQDSLAGDSKTLMVACASPVDYNSEESYCTLNFAARARNIEMGKATKNIVTGTNPTDM